MTNIRDVMTVVQNLEQSTTEAQELLGALGVGQLQLLGQVEQLRRRAIVAELALRQVISEINPHLSLEKQRAEFDRLLGDIEDNRELVQNAMEADRASDKLAG